MSETTGQTRKTNKTRLAVLGGGISALSAIYRITELDGWQDHYDITVYQIGWRLGGKLATGRGANGRIEEHGIHVFQGWYENAFKLVRDVLDEARALYAGWDEPRPRMFESWSDAFERNNLTILADYRQNIDQWFLWPVVFAENPEQPGDGRLKPLVGVIADILRMTAGMLFQRRYLFGRDGFLIRFAESHLSEFAGPDASRFLSWAQRAIRRIRGSRAGRLLDRFEGRVQVFAQRRVDQMLKDAQAHGAQISMAMAPLLAFLEAAVKILVAMLDESAAMYGAASHLNNDIRRDLVIVDLVRTNLRGLIADVWDQDDRKFHFDRIDDIDYREWLRNHRALPATISSSAVNFFYAGTFSNLADEDDAGGALSAATALRGALHALSYKGALVWQAKMGVADTLIMPLYDVLRARGVEFKFFHEVVSVRPADTRDPDQAERGERGEIGEIGEIVIEEQVQLAPGIDEYDPAITVVGFRAWPSAPRWDQLDDDSVRFLFGRGKDELAGDPAPVAEINLEKPWRPRRGQTRVLRRGVDFDQVILGIPVAALADVCGELVDARPDTWGAMVRGISTTATQALQLWLNKDMAELGMTRSRWGAARGPAWLNTVVYANPFSSWADFSHTIEFEDWPESNRPRAAIYFTAPLRDAIDIPGYDDHEFPARQLARVQEGARQWLWSNMGYFFRAATTEGSPRGLGFDRLVSPTNAPPTGKGWRARRFYAQHFSANMAPWERYTLALPGEGKHRMRTDDTGYRNLFVTGDWTDYGLNGGFAEGAVISGCRTAKAVVDAHNRERGADPSGEALAWHEALIEHAEIADVEEGDV